MMISVGDFHRNTCCINHQPRTTTLEPGLAWKNCVTWELNLNLFNKGIGNGFDINRNLRKVFHLSLIGHFDFLAMISLLGLSFLLKTDFILQTSRVNSTVQVREISLHLACRVKLFDCNILSFISSSINTSSTPFT